MLRGFFSDKRATSAVEFALIAPFLLLLVAAILAYGSIFATSISLHRRRVPAGVIALQCASGSAASARPKVGSA